MTTPLGSIEVGPREGRRVTIARTTNETEVTVTLGLDGAGHTGIDTGIGFYDHLLGTLAHRRSVDLIRREEARRRRNQREASRRPTSSASLTPPVIPWAC